MSSSSQPALTSSSPTLRPTVLPLLSRGMAQRLWGRTEEYLGIGGVNHDVIVKFDLFNNAGEGQDSTGMYTNYQPKRFRPSTSPRRASTYTAQTFLTHNSLTTALR